MATSLAVAIETSYGLGDSLLWRGPPETSSADLRLDRDLRARVEAHLQTAEASARSLLAEQTDTIKSLAQVHVMRGVVEREDIEGMIIAASAALEATQSVGAGSEVATERSDPASTDP